MNVRKDIDYTRMYRAIDEAMGQQLPQMQLYAAIGKIVCSRSEKGAAVMTSKYLRTTYPDVQGFSPRNLRRMRDFWRTYENHPALLSLAMQLGWTQNVVLMEADLTMELRKWYLGAAHRFGWSKAVLTAKIAEQAHLEIVLDIEEDVCDNSHNEEESASGSIRNAIIYFTRHILRRRCRGGPKRGGVPWHGRSESLLCGILLC